MFRIGGWIKVRDIHFDTLYDFYFIFQWTGANISIYTIYTAGKDMLNYMGLEMIKTKNETASQMKHVNFLKLFVKKR